MVIITHYHTLNVQFRSRTKADTLILVTRAHGQTTSYSNLKQKIVIKIKSWSGSFEEVYSLVACSIAFYSSDAL